MFILLLVFLSFLPSQPILFAFSSSHYYLFIIIIIFGFCHAALKFQTILFISCKFFDLIKINIIELSRL